MISDEAVSITRTFAGRFSITGTKRLSDIAAAMVRQQHWKSLGFGIRGVGMPKIEMSICNGRKATYGWPLHVGHSLMCADTEYFARVEVP